MDHFSFPYFLESFRLIFIREFGGVFLQFLPCIWVLGWVSSSNSNLGVNPWLQPLRFHGFLLVPLKPRFLSSSKIRREIIGFGKIIFWELVPCAKMTLVSKFHLIWSTIAQESNLGRKGQILRENHVFQRPPTRQFLAPPDNVRCGTNKVQPSVLRSRNPESDNFWLYRTISSSTEQCPIESFSPTFVHYFLVCPIDPILLSLHL
jgi:hypothetical protein